MLNVKGGTLDCWVCNCINYASVWAYKGSEWSGVTEDEVYAYCGDNEAVCNYYDDATCSPLYPGGQH